MKVLKDNYSANQAESKSNKSYPYPRTITCEMCGSELEYEKSDLRMGVFGCMHLDCPLCGYGNMLDDNENNITLTVDNVEFPVHFWHTSVETCAVDVSENKIKKYIYKAIDYFRKNKEEFSWFTEFGSLSMHVYRLDGDENYEVFISKDYYHTYIPFEDEDYE